jgi:hypothetical protein
MQSNNLYSKLGVYDVAYQKKIGQDCGGPGEEDADFIEMRNLEKGAELARRFTNSVSP